MSEIETPPAVPPQPQRREVTAEEVASALLKNRLGQIAKKVRNGEEISREDQKLLQDVASGKSGGGGFAKNYVELANTLGVSRRTIHNWTKSNTDCPVPRPDGRHSITEWRAWIEKHGLDSEVEESPAALKARMLILQTERLQLQVSIIKRDFVPRSEVETAGAQLGTAMRRVITQIHLRAPDFAGRTTDECDRLLREVEDEVLEQLHLIPRQMKELGEGAFSPEAIEDAGEAVPADDPEPEL